ncbi:hypothetical protein J437_LFUL001127 [Ladona fulva]|uniref:Uncharacterized protein n=1 Tax=Ladona fulva TaxID=123851 RepID=A0A8K0JWM7_LADFU|nr:hypothetical protein J437_LFUL001127 [Ladona fulva]
MVSSMGLGVVKQLLSPDGVPDDLKVCGRKVIHETRHLSTVVDEEESKNSEQEADRLLRLDGSTLGDFPAIYEIPASWLKPNEFPAIGLYVDPRIVPGFRYRVRALSGPVNAAEGKSLRDYLFRGRALTLQSIGRGYSRRFTFEADANCLNNNNNYFWSDSLPNGFAFELEIVSPGDKFTVHDANHLAEGTLEVLNIEKPQMETGQRQSGSKNEPEKKGTEKTVRLKLQCKFECFETGSTPQIVMVTGTAIVRKTFGSKVAKIVRVVNVGLGHQRGFSLSVGVHDKKWRRTTVSGEKIGDVPTKYTINGLEAHEQPVIGTYVDPRITPGFHYCVRPAGCPRPLFGGRALRLLSIGPGYGKRITFEPDTLNSPSSFCFWSDSQPEGFGFEPRAVFAGMTFAVCAGGQRLGEAVVFRADNPQEEVEDIVPMKSCKTEKQGVVKRIRVDVTCHVTFNDSDDAQVMRVSGHAIVEKKTRARNAELLRIENVGLDSQLNLLFVNQETDLVFCPLKICQHSTPQ